MSFGRARVFLAQASSVCVKAPLPRAEFSIFNCEKPSRVTACKSVCLTWGLGLFDISLNSWDKVPVLEIWGVFFCTRLSGTRCRLSFLFVSRAISLDFRFWGSLVANAH